MLPRSSIVFDCSLPIKFTTTQVKSAFVATNALPEISAKARFLRKARFLPASVSSVRAGRHHHRTHDSFFHTIQAAAATRHLLNIIFQSLYVYCV